MPEEVNIVNGEMKPFDFSIIAPCYNEAPVIQETVEGIFAILPKNTPTDLIVVNDGSTDGSGEILSELSTRYPSLRIVTHETNLGYGAALKSGIRHALSPIIVTVDADGTYPLDQIPALAERCRSYDMVVGARTGENVQASTLRSIPKWFLRRWASWIARRDIPDINSGLRAFRKDLVEPLFGLLPDTFSFTLTITLAFLTTVRRVEFVPIDYAKRVGKSKIGPFQDTLRFIALIVRTGIYFAPLRVFMPFVGLMFVFALVSLTYDIVVAQNLTDKTVLMFLFTFNTLIFALLADMIDRRTSK